MRGWPAGQRLTVLLVRVILTVAVTVTHPCFADAPSGVLAAKLDIRVTDVGHSLTALLITGVHAISVPIAAPPQGDAQTIQPALELIIVAAARRPCGLVGAVGVCFIAVVPTVVVPVAGPVLGDAAPAVALELGARARVAAASLVAIVPTVIVIVTSPVDVDTSAIVAGKLSQGEAGGISTRG